MSAQGHPVQGAQTAAVLQKATEASADPARSSLWKTSTTDAGCTGLCVLCKVVHCHPAGDLGFSCRG